MPLKALTRILIVGAGIAGLALARALRDSVYDLDVVEKAKEFGSNGCGIVLHPNGVSALGRFGLGDRIAAVCGTARRLRTVRFESALTLSLDDVWDNTSNPTIALPRPLLRDLLAVPEPEAKATQAIVRFACSVTDVESRGRDVAVRFTDGSCGRYGLVVGADGVHSRLRRLLGPDDSVERDGTTYYRYLSRNVIDLPKDVWHTEVQQWGSFGFIGAGLDLLHCYAQLPGDGVPSSAEDQLRYFESRVGALDERLRATFDARCGALHVNPCWTAKRVFWGTDRCVLIGDAAHALSPTLTEGGSLAIEDGIALADALKSQSDVVSAVRWFRRRRQEPVAWAHRMSTAQTRSRARRDPSLPMTAEMAADYLRRMYAPLMREHSTSPRGTSDAGAFTSRLDTRKERYYGDQTTAP